MGRTQKISNSPQQPKCSLQISSLAKEKDVGGSSLGLQSGGRQLNLETPMLGKQMIAAPGRDKGLRGTFPNRQQSPSQLTLAHVVSQFTMPIPPLPE